MRILGDLENRYKFNYDIKKETTVDIKFKQGNIDSSVLEVTLLDNRANIDITGEEIEFRFKKPDNTIVFQDFQSGVKIVDNKKGRIECILMANTIAASGIVVCDIHRKKAGRELTTLSFNFMVEESINGDMIISSNYISAIDNKLIEINNNEEERKKTHLDFKGDIVIGTGLKNELKAEILEVESEIIELNKIKENLQKVIETANTTTYATKGEIISVNTQLAENKQQANENINGLNLSKANKNEVILKGQGTLSDFDEATRRTLQGLSPSNINAVLGTGNVAYENVRKNSIYIDNLGFIKKPSNADIYFTKEMINRYIVNDTNGNLVANADYCTTGFIDVENSLNYFIGLRSSNTPVNVQRFAFYDKDKKFLSFAMSSNNFITPVECKYVRLSFSATWFAKTDDIKVQVNSLTPIGIYESKEDIKINRYETLKEDIVDTKNIKNNIITPNKVQFIKKPLNEDIYFTKEIVNGYILNNTNGNLVASVDYCTTGFIDVDSNSNYFVGLISSNSEVNIQRWCFYNKDKVFLNFGASANNFTTPTDCKYVKLSFSATWFDKVSDIKIQANSLTSSEPYECKIDLKINRYEPIKPIQYLKTEVDDTVKKIIDNTEEQSVSFGFITDLHCDDNLEISKGSLKRQLTSMVEIANNSPLDFICLGGDLFSGNYFKDNKQDAKNLLLELIEPLKNSKKPVYVLKGNHDDNSYYKIYSPTTPLVDEKILSYNEHYAHTNGMLQGVKNSTNNYFYFDIEEKNTRVICLNSANAPTTLNSDGTRKYAGYNYFGYSLEQLRWLLNALDNPNKKYILLSHIGTDIFTVYNRDILNNIISALNTKSTFVGLDTTKDFSNYKGLELYCFGHLHADRLEKTNIVGNAITVSVGSGILDNTVISTEESQSGYTRAIGRKYGEISEALFDVVINKKDEVKCIRFGAGEDRSISK